MVFAQVFFLIHISCTEENAAPFGATNMECMCPKLTGFIGRCSLAVFSAGFVCIVFIVSYCLFWEFLVPETRQCHDAETRKCHFSCKTLTSASFWYQILGCASPLFSYYLQPLKATESSLSIGSWNSQAAWVLDISGLVTETTSGLQ